MATVYASMPPARNDRTADAALERVARAEPGRRLMVPVLDWMLAKYDERPCMDRAAVLAMMERVARAYYARQ